MKIALAQLDYHIGNFESNYRKIRDALFTAKKGGADLVLFAELAICGYPPRDFLEFDDFIDKGLDVVQKIQQITADLQIACVVGAPSRNPVVEGKDLFNSAFFIANGEVLATANKALLPTYDIFDEYRYFEPETEFACVTYLGKKLAITICEDLWNVGNENPMYRICPMDILSREDPDLIINISASPFDYNHAKDRIHVLQANCKRYGLPILYVNHTGAQTEIIFDGGSLVMADNGTVYKELPYFKEALEYISLDDLCIGESSQSISHYEGEQPKAKADLIFRALMLGVQDYFGKLGFTKAILGLSGGVDSALTMVIAAEALGPKNVRGILMPSQFSSDHSISDAEQLAGNLGSPHDTIPIGEVYDSFYSVLQPYFEDKAFDVTEENIQARIRGVYIMALSNKHGYILLNTSNKSEAAVGYSTLYGDMAGGLSVLGDVYKTEVYALCRYYNDQKGRAVIPGNILTKAPSAELRPNQKDSDALPDYAILDKVLFEYIENRKGPRELEDMGFEESLVARILKLVNTSEYKRYQTPPTLRVSPKAFGMGRRMPIVGKYLG